MKRTIQKLHEINIQLESEKKSLKNKNAQLKVQQLRTETEKHELVKKFEEQRLFTLSNEKSLSESQLKNIDLGDGGESDD